MKKKLFVGAIIPLLATFATIGSGFSLWIFNGSHETSDEGFIKINTTKAIGIGEITIENKDTSKIILDQTSSDSNPNGKGIYIENPHIASYKFDSSKYKDYADFVVGYEDGLTDLIFTTTIKIPNEVYNYIDICYANMPIEFISENFAKDGTFKFEEKDECKIFTYTDYYSHRENGIEGITNGYKFFSWNSVYDATTEDYRVASIRYRTTRNTVLNPNKTVSYPETLKEYKEMLSAVKDKSIDVTYKAEVIIKS